MAEVTKAESVKIDIRIFNEMIAAGNPDRASLDFVAANIGFGPDAVDRCIAQNLEVVFISLREVGFRAK